MTPDELTQEWLQAIAYDDYHEERFGNGNDDA